MADIATLQQTTSLSVLAESCFKKMTYSVPVLELELLDLPEAQYHIGDNRDCLFNSFTIDRRLRGIWKLAN